MSDQDYLRVNTPRAEKIMKTLELMEKSAKSYKASDEAVDSLMTLIRSELISKSDTPWQDMAEKNPPKLEKMIVPEIEVPLEQGSVVPTKPIKDMFEHYKGLPTQTLIDTLAAAGAALASRRT